MTDACRFVVQEHHPRRLHWDFRLERDGVLVSWALPRGFPDDPGEDLPAARTEDHPLEYLDFQGTIPEGSYGAGEVRVWDRGTYLCEAFGDRKVVVELHGERLRGRYALYEAREDWRIHRMDPADPACGEWARVLFCIQTCAARIRLRGVLPNHMVRHRDE